MNGIRQVMERHEETMAMQEKGKGGVGSSGEVANQKYLTLIPAKSRWLPESASPSTIKIFRPNGQLAKG